tara:strand:- start:1375 stop:1818 length:444 start_codon:yes stop_codon:yes gene_type:complete
MKNDTIYEKDNVISNFINKEKKELIDFLSGFEIIGLTIASIIGLSVSSLSKTFTDQIIMPIIQPLFSENWKTFTVNIGQSKLGVGLFLSDIIYLTVIIFSMFLLYSLFKTYLGSIIDNKNNSQKNYQMKIINELSHIRKELKKNKKH